MITRCSQYRGSTVDFDSCLNLTDPQFVVSTNLQTTNSSLPQSPFKPRFGPYPAVRAPHGQLPAAGFRPAPARFVSFILLLMAHFLLPQCSQNPRNSPVHIMSNPNRGRGGYVNGRGTSHQVNASGALQHSGPGAHGESAPLQTSDSEVSSRAGARGGGRGAFHPRGRARGFTPTFGRGRGLPPRAPRGRGRGYAAAVPS